MSAMLDSCAGLAITVCLNQAVMRSDYLMKQGSSNHTGHVIMAPSSHYHTWAISLIRNVSTELENLSSS